MANRQRGSSNLRVGDEVYTLRFSTNAMCEIEDLFDCPFSKVIDKLSDVENLSIKDLRRMIWGAMFENNPQWSEPSNDVLAEIGEIVDEVGITVAVGALGDAVKAAFPDPEVSRGKRRTSKKAA